MIYMKKIVYLMHVDWNWIKQRPHFIAGELSHFYDVEIFYRSSLLKQSTQSTKRNGLKIHKFISVPFCYKKWVYPLNKFYLKLVFRFIINKYKPDYVWVPFPSLYAYLPTKRDFKIIYDCMDDATEFKFSDSYKNRILKLEKELIKNSDIIFVSSNNLASKLKKRQKCADKLFLIRNAFDGNILELNKTSKNEKEHENYKVGYIGTVSSWFDFETLEYVLKKFDKIEFHIIGPHNIPNSHSLLQNERIKFYGSIEHEKLDSYTKNFDCMIMPFKLNELVRSVDPVKFYEYINYDKPIISIFYDELKVYSPYVDFYSNKEELVELLDTMVKTGFQKKYSNKQRLEFLKNNSWDRRVSKIIKYFNTI